MTSDLEMKVGIASVAIVSAIILMSGIGMAVAYTSELSGSGEIPVQYLSVDLFDTGGSGGSTPSSELSFTLPAVPSGSDEPPGTHSDGTPVRTYAIRVSSNSMEEAFVYGYFTCPSSGAEAVKYIRFSFGDGSSATLYRDSYRGTLLQNDSASEVETGLEYSESAGCNCKDFTITGITVCFYPGTTSSGSSILWGHVEIDGTGDYGVLSRDDALNLAGIEFHFLASRVPLLSSE